jgi:hypothetical protein
MSLPSVLADMKSFHSFAVSVRCVALGATAHVIAPTAWRSVCIPEVCHVEVSSLSLRRNKLGIGWLAGACSGRSAPRQHKQTGHPDHQHAVPRRRTAPAVDLLVSRIRFRVSCSINRSQLGEVPQPLDNLPHSAFFALYRHLLCTSYAVSTYFSFLNLRPIHVGIFAFCNPRWRLM